MTGSRTAKATTTNQAVTTRDTTFCLMCQMEQVLRQNYERGCADGDAEESGAAFIQASHLSVMMTLFVTAVMSHERLA